MELKNYLLIVKKRWWIVLIIVAATLVSTYFFTINQPLTYESTTTFVMRPRPSASAVDNDETVKAVDILSNRVEINTTYAQVAKSNLIKEKTKERLGLSSTERKGLSVQSKVIAGTNVLEISVQGPDSTIVRDFANVVGAETQTYISNLYDIFELEPLDEAEIAREPINSNIMLNLVVGGILGLILGLVVAILAEYFLGREEQPTTFDIIDHESGAYNEAYLKLRLRQEMSRAKRNNYPFSLALINVSYPGIPNRTEIKTPDETLRRITTAIGTGLRDEDVLARFEKTTFALLLFDLTGQSAKLLLQELQIKLETAPPKMIGSEDELNIQVTAGVAAYEEDDTEMDELLAQADYALKNAENTAFGAVNLYIKANSSDTLHRNGHTYIRTSPTA